MKSYEVTFTLGGRIVVEAENTADAVRLVTHMDMAALAALADDRLEIQDVVEA